MGYLWGSPRSAADLVESDAAHVIGGTRLSSDLVLEGSKNAAVLKMTASLNLGKIRMEGFIYVLRRRVIQTNAMSRSGTYGQTLDTGLPSYTRAIDSGLVYIKQV